MIPSSHHPSDHTVNRRKNFRFDQALFARYDGDGVCINNGSAVEMQTMKLAAKPVPPGSLSDVCCDQSPDPVAQAKQIAYLLRAGAAVGETDKNGVTPLHHAVRFRSPAAVRALLAGGANVNKTCKRSGSTALHRAVTSTGAPGTAGKQADAREIVSLLLAAGADPSLRNKRDKTPSDYATDETIRALLTIREKARRTKRCT